MRFEPSSRSGPAAADAPARVLVDAHVHLHPCFDLGESLRCAWRNFASAASGDAFSGLLLLTEAGSDNVFRALAELADAGRPVGTGQQAWSVARTGEAEALAVTGPDGQHLVLIAGRQVQTRERLEVLALGTLDTPPDGIALPEAVDRARKAGALPAIPWGFGKWWGRRGRFLTRYLQEVDGEIFLGDNSARPWFFREPRQFALARDRGVSVLPGSDPLPMASEAWRPGSFGFWFEGSIDPTSPCRSLKAQLRSSGFAPRPYGPAERALHFVWSQACMQVLKRRPQRGE